MSRPPGHSARALQAFAGLFGAPGAWILQMTLGEPLAANACYPYRAPLDGPRFEGLVPLLAAVSAACLVLGLLSFRTAWAAWKKTRHAAEEEKDGASGGRTSRARFFAVTGMISGGIFIAAILLTACAVFLVSPCRPWF